MTGQQELNIQNFIEDRIEKIDHRHETQLEAIGKKNQKQREWLMRFIIVLFAGILSMGTIEIIGRVNNANKVKYLELRIDDTIPAQILLDVHKTYELEFWAIAALFEGNDEKLAKIMKEFSEYRWSKLDKYMFNDAGRGNSKFLPWWRPILPDFSNRKKTARNSN